MKNLLRVLLVINIILAATGCTGHKTGDYPVKPVPFTSVKLTDDFWAPRIKKNAEITIPIAFGYCESTGRIKNFEIAGGLDTGKFQTLYPFDDSDVFKIIEGASYSLQTFPDPKLEAYLDTLIWKIGLAQEDDGYLYTNRTIAEMHGGEGLHEWASPRRWELDSVLSHELYNIGHLYEAAVAHYQATGKRTLLDIAMKSADLVAKDFGYDRLKVYPGHQVIEMGLAKLYRITGDEKYLDLAKFFLDIRGPEGQEYNQAHILPVDQTEAVGHAVRATYMYSGMADIAALKNDNRYLNAITRIWEDLVYRKMYVTGGIGASGGNEGFAGPYVLPNMTAYCETCASIGNIFFNHRLFLFHGDAKYYDIIEKTLYNSMLSGVSLSADRFFYPNPLESKGQHKRQAWFGCACCPSNIARFMPAIPGYIYAVADKDIYINLYASNRAKINAGKQNIVIVQDTQYPWEGRVEISVEPEKETNFTLRLRIPGWVRNEAIPGRLYRFTNTSGEKFSLTVNGIVVKYSIDKGYAVIKRKWKKGDRVVVDFPMPVRVICADERVKDDAGRVAFQRGPFVYCAEWPDNNTGNVRNLIIDTTAVLSTMFRNDLLGGVQIITVQGRQATKPSEGEIRFMEPEPVTLIPYAYWNNRGPGQMIVWLPVKSEAAGFLKD
ncbi:MAG TPA: glycoside hydrolase family 127 protein [Bacteroidales bacterium]|nr:glycoside hydrolase family 127 protein [Bacteroidales bacterium]HOK74102.1 glycoside hydrolase family 127 protein [Bacteroidales bacterium]HOM40482.1 glycoside hydrolase family 127 protein [Bacteroidales bacterium]HOU30420.1 glycoside hydrolase family 127 protein [Bacteroidales bacterium]HPP92568.1 glycoside hydrolase family 127 protein [Bacteroidales bacterium]